MWARKNNDHNWQVKPSRMTSIWKLLLMATRNPVSSPVEVGSLSHYLRQVYTFQVVGDGISETSTLRNSTFLDLLDAGSTQKPMDKR